MPNIILHIGTFGLANTILEEAKLRGTPINNMKLQRLMYLVFASYYQQTGNLLFSEPWQTWAYGPVCQSAYWVFSCYHAKPIKKYATDARGFANRIDASDWPELHRTIVGACVKYLPMETKALCELTRQKGGAWWKAFQADKETLTPKDILTDPCGRIGD